MSLNIVHFTIWKFFTQPPAFSFFSAVEHSFGVYHSETHFFTTDFCSIGDDPH